MVESYGPSPAVFGGFMIAFVVLSLVLCIFVPDTRKQTYYKDVEVKEIDESIRVN